ncbi:MAG TPA: serine/threonine-protein kinase [Leptolyngbyaceae cyanobacterium]
MSLCINPQCLQPDHPENSLNRTCQACGSDLLLQGRYRVMRLISSQSGFGKVYEAYERNVPKILKVLKESHTGNSKVLELFQREAVVLSRLNHPGVPKVEPEGYFVYHPEGSSLPLHCIVMERIDGPNLRQWMVQQGNHPVSEQQALLWLTQLADVLHLVHQQNYFHRDIKPENVMLRSSGQLVLVDFGAAREVTETYVAHLGASGITTVSSAGYTPPEQEQGQAVPQSDFYALGRTIIYLLTAKTPNDPTIYDSRTNAFNWRSQAAQVSPSFAQLIDDLIAPRAMDRPQTTQAILERLAAVRVAQPVANLPTPGSITQPDPWPETTLDPPQPSAPVQTQPQAQTTQVGQRLPWPWILVGLAALGLLVAMPLAWSWRVRSQEGIAQVTPVKAPETSVALVKNLVGHKKPIKSLVLLRDNNTLISGSEDTTIRLWDLEQGTEIKQLMGHTGSVNTLVVGPGDQTLFSAGTDRNILIWDLTAGKVKLSIKEAHSGIINGLSLSSDGKVLASASADDGIKLWNAETGKLIRRLDVHNKIVNTLAFSQDGGLLVSGGESLLVWNVASGAVKSFYDSQPNFINGVAISSDNTTLISVGSDRMVRLWNLTTGEPIKSVLAHSSFVNEVRISWDGGNFVTAGADKTLGIWDMQSKQLLKRLTGFDSDVYRFVLLSNDQIATVGGNDHKIKVWQPESK